MPLVFDTEDHTNKPMVIEPEETEDDDELGNDNDNNSMIRRKPLSRMMKNSTQSHHTNTPNLAYGH